MNCPNCNRKMTDKSYEYYGWGSWDMDYPDQFHEEFKCGRCNISYINGQWKIPRALCPSEKQVKTVSFIENVLGKEAPPPTKNLYWKFIGEYLQRTVDILNERSAYDEYDWDGWEDTDLYPSEDFFY